MNSENVLAALDSLSSTHDIDPYVFGAALVESLRDAIIRHYGTADAYVSLDIETGQVRLEALPAEGNPIAVTLDELGRRGAAAIKDAFDRTVTEARTERLAELLAKSSGSLVVGRVTQSSREAAIVTLPDGTEAELLSSNAPGLRFRTGTQVSAILTGAVDSSGGTPRARLTRRGNEFIEALFAEAVPSVADGSIRLVAIARDPGNRTKVLVAPANPGDPDPVGLIIGTKGATIRKIADEIYPERIDVLSVGSTEEMVTAALSPGRVVRVTEEADGSAVAWIPASERAAVLGRSGTNLRLASALLGLRIDLKTLGEGTDANAEETTPSNDPPSDLPAAA